RFITSLLRFDHLHNVIKNRTWNLLEPVRRTGTNDNYVSLAQAIGLSALNTFSQLLVWPAYSAANHPAAGNKSRFAIENVESIGLFRVYLDMTGPRAFHHHDGKVRSRRQICSAGGGSNLRMAHVSHILASLRSAHS